MRKNATYTAFREVGRVIRTMRLLLISRGGRSGHRGDRLPSAHFWVAGACPGPRRWSAWGVTYMASSNAAAAIATTRTTRTGTPPSTWIT
ncbi:hypothetical protein ACFRQM_24965 [Streptomyces sp. NPDC056831]|uniref:hypothetical protein n=1 Tax=Streptomyces sp. NPDC056831 TaxID=3345954 RepID=UPI0036B46A68